MEGSGNEAESDRVNDAAKSPYRSKKSIKKESWQKRRDVAFGNDHGESGGNMYDKLANKHIHVLPLGRSSRSDEYVSERDPSERGDRAILFARMRKLIPQVQSGIDVRDVLDETGRKLNYNERSALLRVVPKSESRLTGRHFVQPGNGTVVARGYTCNHNLAGRLFIITLDGVFNEVPIKASNEHCGHDWCSSDHIIRPGVVDDAILLVIPKLYSQCAKGLLRVGTGETIQTWNDIYHQSVVATKLARDTLPFARFRAILGFNYMPKTQFGQVAVFMAKMLGMQDIGFLHYSEHSELMQDIFAMKRGACEAFRIDMEHIFPTITERLSNYAWGLHHMCQLKSLYPHIDMPFQFFLANIDKLSSKTKLAVRHMTIYFEQVSGKIETIGPDVLEDHNPSLEDELNSEIIAAALISRMSDRRSKSDNAVKAIIDGSLHTDFLAIYKSSGITPVMLDIVMNDFTDGITHDKKLKLSSKYLRSGKDPFDQTKFDRNQQNTAKRLRQYIMESFPDLEELD